MPRRQKVAKDPSGEGHQDTWQDLQKRPLTEQNFAEAWEAMRAAGVVAPVRINAALEEIKT